MVKPPGMKKSSATAPVDMVPTDNLVALVAHPQEEANERHRLDEYFNGTLGLADILQGDLSHVLTWVESLPERVELRIDCCKDTESPEEMSMKRSSTSFTEWFNDTILHVQVLITVVVGSLLVGMVYHLRARVPCIHKHLTCQSWTIREPNHEEDYRHHSIMSNPFGFDMVFNKLTLFKDLHNHLLFIGVYMAIFELARLVDMDAIIKTVRRSPAKIGGHSMPVLIVLLLFASVGDVMANGTGVDSDGGETGDVHVCKGDFCVTAKVAILVPLGTALLVAGGFCWRRALACCSCCCRLWCWPSATEGNIMTDSPPQQQADAQPLMQTQVSNLVTLVRILFVAFVTMLTGTRRVAPVSRAPSVGGVSLV